MTPAPEGIKTSHAMLRLPLLVSLLLFFGLAASAKDSLNRKWYLFSGVAAF